MALSMEALTSGPRRLMCVSLFPLPQIKLNLEICLKTGNCADVRKDASTAELISKTSPASHRHRILIVRLF